MNAGIRSLSLRPRNDRKGVQRPHAQTTPLFGRALRGSAGLGEAVGGSRVLQRIQRASAADRRALRSRGLRHRSRASRVRWLTRPTTASKFTAFCCCSGIRHCIARQVRVRRNRVWTWIQECGSSRCSRACVLSFHGHAMMSFSPPFLLWRPPLEGSRRHTSLCDRQLASGLFPLVGRRLHSPRSRRIYAGAPGAAVKAGRLRPHFLGVALTVAWLPARYTHRVRLDLSATRENARIELCDPSCDVPS
jgi:hypothetical protein